MSDRKIGAVAKALIDAKARIVDEDNWCQGRFVRMWRQCALGATRDARGLINYTLWEFLNDVAQAKFNTNTVYLNDEVGHAAVMQLYDYAIARALSEGI